LTLRGQAVMTCPIKGTRPRRAEPQEDDRERQALIDSPKEQAELAMITDLLRNDLGRVCEFGSVQVSDSRKIESFSAVHHSCSTIEGTLRNDLDVVDLLQALLPGGAVSVGPQKYGPWRLSKNWNLARGVRIAGRSVILGWTGR